MSSLSVARREKEKTELRGRILDAARDLMVAEGPDALSMRRIAERIHYSPTAIYLHFKDKDELISELMTHDYLELGIAFARVAEVEDPIDRLRQAAWLYLRFGIEKPHHYRLMFMTPLSPEQVRKNEETGAAHKGRPDQDSYAMLQAIIQLAMDAGVVRKSLTDVDLISQVCWTAIHGVVSLHIAKGDTTWCNWKGPEAIAEQAIDAMLSWLTRKE